MEIPMDTSSIFLARVFGLYMVLVSLAILINLRNLQETLRDLLSNKGLLFLTGIFTLILGLLLVLSHNVWTADWRVIITLFSWITLVKGFTLIAFTPNLSGFYQKMISSRTILGFSYGVSLLLGAFLIWKGFF